MMKKISSLIIGSIILSIAMSFNANSQIDETFRTRLESILSKFKNYRYSTISIYRIKESGDIRKAIRAEDEKLTRRNVTAGTDCVKNADPNVRNFVESQLAMGNSSSAIKRELVNRGIAIPDDIDCIIEALQGDGGALPNVRNAYVVTTRMHRDQIEPSSIIAMIVSYEDEELIEKSVGQVMPRNIYTNPELFQFELDENEYRSKNMYELIITAFRQNNVENKTLEAQGIGTFRRLAPPVYGKSQSLILREGDISPFEVQTFLRISEGQPFDYNFVKNEVVVSPDLISWRQYEMPTITYSDGFVDTITTITNKGLPKFGLDLKYGLDEINYPSLWSERMSLSAIWENVKLGVILPTNGWSSLSEDVFDTQRKLTHGGVGISARADFPIKVIPQSGVFSINMGYVFGDAKEADYKKRITDPDNPNFNGDMLRNLNILSNFDHFIRFNTSLHYTFAISIDEDYWLRFGIGGTAYTVEKWYNRVSENDDNETVVDFVKRDGETIAGISAKFDFMSRNIATPYGATLQYFDESLYANIWLQIPIVQNRFALRLDAKGYMTAFRDKPRLWENKSVFMPMARFIVTF